MANERGFTLIEALVALAIAATALVVLMGRLGSSADLQRTLMAQALAIDEAQNLLAERMLKPVGKAEQSGRYEAAGYEIDWRIWNARTTTGKLVRQNVSVDVGHLGQFELFVYRRQQR